ncbi:MAG: low-specificity L-threonine aldolase [bacterium]
MSRCYLTMSGSIIDLRSDTVTRPTEEMRRAMFDAVVGDDVYGEDPTVNRLQEIAAAKVGKEDALFVPSGTMGNEVAVKTHTQPGDEMILEARSHIYNYEAGATAAISGVQIRAIYGEDGAMDPAEIRRAIRARNEHFPVSRLICLENTHNGAGGTVIPLSIMKETYDLAKEFGLAVHLDGARIFNAAIALGVDAKEIARYSDSVMFCLSKGLSAPVGSILAGSREFIERARRYRKMFGGGMRQAGVIAAAGIVALEKMVDRLKEDHENARILAKGLSEIEGVEVNFRTVQTNMVYAKFRGYTAQGAAERLRERGVLVSFLGRDSVRMVTHREIGREDVLRTIEIARTAFESRS